MDSRHSLVGQYRELLLDGEGTSVEIAVLVVALVRGISTVVVSRRCVSHLNNGILSRPAGARRRPGLFRVGIGSFTEVAFQ